MATADFDWYGTCAAAGVSMGVGWILSFCAFVLSRSDRHVHRALSPARVSRWLVLVGASYAPHSCATPRFARLDALSRLACRASQAEGVEGILAGDTAGNIFSSFPLAEDGNYQFWIFSDPYKATVTKEDGSEVEEDIYEAYNFGLVST